MSGTVHRVDTTAKLVRMANQIARNLTHDKDPVAAMAEHIHAFWTVRMQQQLFANGGEGLDEAAIAAIEQLKLGAALPHRNAAADERDHGSDAG
jgi:formate dehydrogenase subunit delta